MKILFIACYSPLINNSAAIETLQYLNKLISIPGNEVHLLTVDFPMDSVYYDETLLNMMDKRIKLYLVEGGPVFKRLMPRKSNMHNVKSAKDNSYGIKKTLRKIKNAVVIPDMYYGWSKKAADFGKELMKKENFDVIFSMHEPPSSHLCAYEIKKQYKNVPWITYWSDPWLKDSTRAESNFIKKDVEKNMEKKIVNLADRFIFVTEDNLKEYEKDYKELKNKTKKCYLLNRGFDSEFYKKILNTKKVPELIKPDKINIIYTGEIFSKLRNIRPFIEALKLIKNENKEIYNSFNVLFFGNIDDEEAKEELQNLEIASVSKRIPFEDAVNYMLHGEILLLFGNKNSKQIPAKVYDYLGTEGRIFVIYGDENDPLKKVTASNDKCINVLNESEEIKNKLKIMYNLYADGILKSPPDMRYEWSSVVDRLNNILAGREE